MRSPRQRQLFMWSTIGLLQLHTCETTSGLLCKISTPSFQARYGRKRLASNVRLLRLGQPCKIDLRTNHHLQGCGMIFSPLFTNVASSHESPQMMLRHPCIQFLTRDMIVSMSQSSQLPKGKNGVCSPPKDRSVSETTWCLTLLHGTSAPGNHPV